MNDIENLLGEVDGRLTAVTVKMPDTKNFIWSLQKHVKYALNEPQNVRMGKFLKKTNNWLTMVKWKHPMFKDDFDPIVKLIDKFQEEHGG
jgi:hypothetical protein